MIYDLNDDNHADKGKEKMKKYATILALLQFILSWNALSQVSKNENKAKEHFLKAKTFVDEGAYEKAIIELKASYDLDPVPNVLYNIAVCYDRLQKYFKAVKYYSLYLKEGKKEPENKRKVVSERIKELKNFFGEVIINVDSSGAEVTIDGEPVCTSPCPTLFLDTGEHEIVVKKGINEIKKNFTVLSKEKTEISINISPTGKEKEKKKKTLHPSIFWSLLGLTLASGISQVVLTGIVIKKDREVSDMFIDDPDYEKVRSDRKKLAITADVISGFTAGFAIASIVTFFYTDFKKERNKERKVNFNAYSFARDSLFVFGIEGEF